MLSIHLVLVPMAHFIAGDISLKNTNTYIISSNDSIADLSVNTHLQFFMLALFTTTVFISLYTRLQNSPALYKILYTNSMCLDVYYVFTPLHVIATKTANNIQVEKSFL